MFDLIKCSLQLNVPQVGVWLMLPYCQLNACNAANLLGVHPTLTDNGTCKRSINTNFCCGWGTKACCSSKASRLRRFHVGCKSSTHWGCHMAIMGWNNRFSKLPFPMCKMALLPKFATISSIILVAHARLYGRRGQTIGDCWRRHKISGSSDCRVAQIGHLWNSSNASRYIVQEMTPFTKWAPSSAASRKSFDENIFYLDRDQCYLSKETRNRRAGVLHKDNTQVKILKHYHNSR